MLKTINELSLLLSHMDNCFSFFLSLYENKQCAHSVKHLSSSMKTDRWWWQHFHFSYYFNYFVLFSSQYNSFSSRMTCLCSRLYKEYQNDEQFLSLNRAQYVIWLCVLAQCNDVCRFFYISSSYPLWCWHTPLRVLVKHAVGGTHSCSLLWQLTARYDAFDRLEFSRSICLCRSDCILAPGTARGTVCHQRWICIRDIILLWLTINLNSHALQTSKWDLPYLI